MRQKIIEAIEKGNEKIEELYPYEVQRIYLRVIPPKLQSGTKLDDNEVAYIIFLLSNQSLRNNLKALDR